MEILGIDIGATNISGAPINVRNGDVLADVYEEETPDPATPEALAEVVNDIVEHFDWQGKPLGVAFPAVVKDGIVATAVNIAPDWVDQNARELFKDATGCPVAVINDADAAGLAEIVFGAGQGRKDKVLLVTIGTGLGVALFENGSLIPNIEFPDVKVRGEKAEKQASGRALSEKNLSWEEWAAGLDEYLDVVQERTEADLIILGGGVSEEYDEFADYLTVDAELAPAQYRGMAGILGAALAARSIAGD